MIFRNCANHLLEELLLLSPDLTVIHSPDMRYALTEAMKKRGFGYEEVYWAGIRPGTIDRSEIDPTKKDPPRISILKCDKLGNFLLAYHPSHGGQERTLIALNAAIDWMRGEGMIPPA